MNTLIQDAVIINEGRSFVGSVLIDGAFVAAVYEEGDTPRADGATVINARGQWLLPGVIDDHVHFREPGMTHKGTIASESRAAVAGGVTTFMDMPNTNPKTVTRREWEWKMERAAETSAANYAFYFGGSDNNADEIRRLDPTRVPGLKLFLGSSTGNGAMNADTVRRIFGETDLPIAVHAEEESIIERNRERYINLMGEDLPPAFHTKIRNAEACYASSSRVVELADKMGVRLHVLHVSTERELSLFATGRPLTEKKITAEVCVHHLWFTDADYAAYGNRIKWNPSIKSFDDREALRHALLTGAIDIVATDHAPHLPAEKEGSCLTAASGGPMMQHTLVAMLELAARGVVTREQVVQKMAHNPADLFHIDRRGYIRPGYYADLVLVDPASPWRVTRENLLYHCGWSPMEGQTFQHVVRMTFVNGQPAYADGRVSDTVRGMAVQFVR